MTRPKTSQINACVGKALRMYRKAQLLKQEEMAKAMNLNQSSWSRIENGESPVTVEHLFVAASILQIDAVTIWELANTLQESKQT